VIQEVYVIVSKFKARYVSHKETLL